MTLRDTRQAEFAKNWIDRGQFGILNLCPRFGKMRVAINIFKELSPKRILIAYPDVKIKEQWENEFILCDYKPKEVVYSTFISLYKYENEVFDIIVLDEIHLLSENQLNVCSDLIRNNKKVLGLTGTLSHWTREEIRNSLNLNVVGVYPIETAITEGIISDYQITVYKVPLDGRIKQQFGRHSRTEKAHFDNVSWVIDKKERDGEDTKFLRFNRARIIQNSLGKLNKTKELLASMKDKRVLVFCGGIKTADSLGIPSHHSKSKKSEIFEKFASGEGDKLAVIKIGNTGVTYKPLDTVIINFFDSNSENMAQKINRCMSMEYNNPEKIAKIIIISSNEDVELNWLNKALKFFDQSKIKYL